MQHATCSVSFIRAEHEPEVEILTTKGLLRAVDCAAAVTAVWAVLAHPLIEVVHLGLQLALAKGVIEALRGRGLRGLREVQARLDGHGVPLQRQHSALAWWAAPGGPPPWHPATPSPALEAPKAMNTQSRLAHGCRSSLQQAAVVGSPARPRRPSAGLARRGGALGLRQAGAEGEGGGGAGQGPGGVPVSGAPASSRPARSSFEPRLPPGTGGGVRHLRGCRAVVLRVFLPPCFPLVSLHLHQPCVVQCVQPGRV